MKRFFAILVLLYSWSVHAALSLKEEVELRGFTWGAPVFIRIFKQENVLELWLQIEDGSFRLFRDFPICIYSGELGPKTRQGDKQSPEGFYQFNRWNMNPHSRFYRSFDLNYPNAYDRYHGYSGSLLMVHGKCSSVGCYAMGDKQMAQIYQIVEAAFQHGQDWVQVHAFPFRLKEQRLSAYHGHRWYAFWRSLQPAYGYFEHSKRLPRIEVVGGQYRVFEAARSAFPFNPRQDKD